MHHRFMQVLERADEGGNETDFVMRRFWCLPDPFTAPTPSAAALGPVVDIAIWRRARQRRGGVERVPEGSAAEALIRTPPAK